MFITSFDSIGEANVGGAIESFRDEGGKAGGSRESPQYCSWSWFLFLKNNQNKFSFFLFQSIFQSQDAGLDLLQCQHRHTCSTVIGQQLPAAVEQCEQQ
jgi:hypothetical protein